METTGEGLTSPAPPPRGQAQNPPAATLSQIKFFHSMWTNLFAVADTHEHPPAGVIRQGGEVPPLAREAAAQAANMQL